MQITAGSLPAREAYKFMTRYLLFRRSDPKKKMIAFTVVFVLTNAALIWAMSMAGSTGWMTAFLCVEWAAYLFCCYYYFLLPKLHYNSLGERRDVMHMYEFGDDAVRIVSSGSAVHEKRSIGYGELLKVFETASALYFVADGSSAYSVDKHTMQGGTPEELREKLFAAVGDDYTVCAF